MTNNIVLPLPQRPGLGRNIRHDPRSALHTFDTSALDLVDAEHAFHLSAPMDQVNTGKCTAEAATEIFASDPFWPTYGPSVQSTFNDTFSDGFYHQETVEDPYPGTWPGIDTGSDGLTSAKVAKERGLIDSYQHTFSGEAARLALTKYPISLGMLWKDGCDNVNTSTGEITYTGSVRGGHQICGYKIEVALQRLWFHQSWGPWGYHNLGLMWMSFGMLDDVLGDQGDVTVFLPNGAPPPPPIPNPGDADLALLAAGNAWEPWIFSRLTKAGKFKAAFEVWKITHGLR